MEKVFTSKITK